MGFSSFGQQLFMMIQCHQTCRYLMSWRTRTKRHSGREWNRLVEFWIILSTLSMNEWMKEGTKEGGNDWRLTTCLSEWVHEWVASKGRHYRKKMKERKRVALTMPSFSELQRRAIGTIWETKQMSTQSICQYVTIPGIESQEITAWRMGACLCRMSWKDAIMYLLSVCQNVRRCDMQLYVCGL